MNTEENIEKVEEKVEEKVVEKINLEIKDVDEEEEVLDKSIQSGKP